MFSFHLWFPLLKWISNYVKWGKHGTVCVLLKLGHRLYRRYHKAFTWDWFFEPGRVRSEVNVCSRHEEIFMLSHQCRCNYVQVWNKYQENRWHAICLQHRKMKKVISNGDTLHNPLFPISISGTQDNCHFPRPFKLSASLPVFLNWKITSIRRKAFDV